jgi:hypothetical protein
MSVSVSPTRMIELRGECPSEDAETLLGYLLADPSATVDWSGCETAHTAVIQVLLLAKPAMHGIPAGHALRTWVQPLLASPAV